MGAERIYCLLWIPRPDLLNSFVRGRRKSTSSCLLKIHFLAVDITFFMSLRCIKLDIFILIQ